MHPTAPQARPHEAPQHHRHLELYLTALASAAPRDWFLEIRYRRAEGMGRFFTPVPEVDKAADRIRKVGAQTDVFVSVAPRTERSGGAAAVGHHHVVWADLDTPEAIAAAEDFPHPPSIVVNSGNGKHYYWVTDEPREAAETVRANRRLALHLGGDLNCTDSARVMRAPDTFNFKDPENPKLVTVERVNLETYSLDILVDHLPDPPDGRSSIRMEELTHTGKLSSSVRTEHWRAGSEDDPLMLVTPVEYVEAFTGQQVGRDGKVECPFHGPERTPSLHVYAEPEQGFHCFGCQKSGSIYDFCGYLWNMDTRGKDFIALRKRIATELLKAVR